MLGSFFLYKYLALIPLGFVEGPTISVFSGYLARIGYLDLFLVMLVFVCVDILSDSFYYFLGTITSKNRFIQSFFNKKLSGKKVVFTSLWEKHILSVLFFGKIAYGISVPIIMSAGALHIPLKRFFVWSIPVSIIQTSSFVLLGYALGEVYLQITNYVRYPVIFVGVVSLLILFLLFYIQIRMKKLLMQ